MITFRGAAQAEVARATGVGGESVLSDLVRGQRTMARKTIETLARYFKVAPGLVFAPGGGIGPRRRSPPRPAGGTGA